MLQHAALRSGQRQNAFKIRSTYMQIATSHLLPVLLLMRSIHSHQRLSFASDIDPCTSWNSGAPAAGVSAKFGHMQACHPLIDTQYLQQICYEPTPPLPGMINCCMQCTNKGMCCQEPSMTLTHWCADAEDLAPGRWRASPSQCSEPAQPDQPQQAHDGPIDTQYLLRIGYEPTQPIEDGAVASMPRAACKMQYIMGMWEWLRSNS